jgi:hypothetical protein
MEKISWTDYVRNEDVLLRVKEQRNILHEIRKRKANWIGHILRWNCFLQRVTEGKIQGGIEVTGRQGRRRRKLLDGLKERRGCSHLKEEVLDRTMWRGCFGRGFGPVVRQTTKWMNERIASYADIISMCDYCFKPRVNKFRDARRLNCLRLHGLFVGPRYGTCIISPFWRPEFWDGS